MNSSLQDTPRSNRLHIGVFGPGNAGKSSLVNALTGHEVAIVSPTLGTTTDPVYKSMEINPLGPCVIIDTAGFDDDSELGGLRVERTVQALEKSDIALLVMTPEDVEGDNGEILRTWAKDLQQRKIPFLAVVNKVDTLAEGALNKVKEDVKSLMGKEALMVSAAHDQGVSSLMEALMRLVPENWDNRTITGNLAQRGDVVLLVMPQDLQAPKGRLILPQVQTIRELLDKKCLVMSATTDNLEASLQALSRPPELIITDSQAFPQVYACKPAQSKLTSFSILLAGYKGDIQYFTEGAQTLGKLTEQSRVLIAEACTHAPLAEDIGREKIPAMLRKRVGPGLKVKVVSGTDFPLDLTEYDVIIHCGACMFNRRYMLSRVQRAREQQVPMTNYGVALAWLGGILDKVELAG